VLGNGARCDQFAELAEVVLETAAAIGTIQSGSVFV
jgi:hypothetical protein